MYRGLSVAVVVPAYNEAGHVGDVIDGLPGFVDRVYVVDDGSTDGTWEEIREHSRARNRDHEGRFDELVVPVSHERNRGVGGAIKTGYRRARDEGIDATAVLAGDDQMDPAEIPTYLDPIADGDAGYVKGNRFTHPDDWASMPRFRLVGNVVLSLLTKVASGYWESMDSQNGYTAISLEALRRTDLDGMYEYYGYCNDLLVRLNAADVRVADVPRSSEYAYADGWKSHIDYVDYVPRVSVMLLRSFLWRLRRKYLVTGFHPLAPLYVLGMAVLGTGLAGLLASLAGRGRDGPGTWLVATVTGALTFVYAATLDRADNEALQVVVERPATRKGPADADDSGPATAADADTPDRARELSEPGGDGARPRAEQR